MTEQNERFKEVYIEDILELPAVSVKLDDLQSFSLLVKTLSLKETRSYRLSRF